MKKILLMAMYLTFALTLYAQDNQITGKILDASTNTPIEGAIILIEGKNAGATDENGFFSITCKENMVIQVSYVGYQKIEQTIKDCSEQIIISLTAETQLKEVEVTATSNPNKSLLDQPVSIVTLKEVELKRSTGLFLDDAINTNVPGVTMERRSHSGGQQLNIRGYGNGVGFKGANNNFDSQGLKMYLNGIPITDAEGVTVMDDIDFGSISNVEISKGPSGSLYGLAIAGVLNLQTQKASKDKSSIGQDFMVGSNGLMRTTTRLTIGGKRSSLLVNYGHQKFDGFMPHTASKKDFVNVIGDYQINEKQTITSYLGYSNSYDERNGELTKLQYDTFDYSGNPRYIQNDAHSAVVSYRSGFGHTYKFNKNFSNTTSFFGSSQSMDQSSAGGWTDKNSVNYGLRTTFDLQLKLTDKVKLSGITGAEIQKMNALTSGYSMGADSTNRGGYNIITGIKSIQAIESATGSYFTQWTLSIPKEISITAGIGYSNMNLSLEDRLWGLTNNTSDNTKLKEYNRKYNNLVSPTFAVNKKLNKVASVYASYSIGYKAPVGSNILIPLTGQVNTGLKPEKGTQIEIGTKGDIFKHRLFYTIALFNTRFTNKMTTVAVQNPENTATLYSYIINGGGLINNGLELLVKYTFIESKENFFTSLRPFVNLTYSNFKYDNFQYQKIGKEASKKDSLMIEDYSGNAVAGVPPLVFNLGFDIDTRPGIYGNVNFNYRDAMYYTSDELNKTSSYSLLNAKVGFRRSIARFNVDAYFAASNITGTQYYHMVFINQLPDAYIPAYNKINWFGGVNLKYNF